MAPIDEHLFTPADHTAAVAFCLRERKRLTADASFANSVLRRAADIADGRIRRVLASASQSHAGSAEPVLEGLRIGLRTAQDLLEAGGPTIYRPGYWMEQEGMFARGAFVTEIDVAAAAQRATARLADVGATAAVQAGSRCHKSRPEDVVHDAILAAVAASVPVALVLAEGAHNQ